MEYALAISDVATELRPEHLPADIGKRDPDNTDAECNGIEDSTLACVPLVEVERRYILSVYERCHRHHN